MQIGNWIPDLHESVGCVCFGGASMLGGINQVIMAVCIPGHILLA